MSWWSKKVLRKKSASDVAQAPTPAVSVPAPQVSAPISEGAATESTVQSIAQAQSTNAKGKRKLTINMPLNGIGVNF